MRKGGIYVTAKYQHIRDREKPMSCNLWYSIAGHPLQSCSLSIVVGEGIRAHVCTLVVHTGRKVTRWRDGQPDCQVPCRMPQKLSVTGDSRHINCPPILPGPAIFVTACHKNCPGGFQAFCTGGLFDATIVCSLQTVALKLSVAYTERLLSFLLGGTAPS